MRRLLEHFSEKDVELVLLVLKAVGFSLRKQDPVAMKNFIIAVKEKATAASSTKAG
jgi:nucleolar MIF4G domain-containing protein 1